MQEEAPELGERVRREQHQRQVEGAQDEESRRLRDLWEGKKRKRATGRDDGVDVGNVDGASHGRCWMGALGQSRAKAARAGRSGRDCVKVLTIQFICTSSILARSNYDSRVTRAPFRR